MGRKLLNRAGGHLRERDTVGETVTAERRARVLTLQFLKWSSARH